MEASFSFLNINVTTDRLAVWISEEQVLCRGLGARVSGPEGWAGSERKGQLLRWGQGLLKRGPFQMLSKRISLKRTLRKALFLKTPGSI